MSIYTLSPLCYQMLIVLIKNHNSISLTTAQHLVYIDTAIVVDNRKIWIVCEPFDYLSYTLRAIRSDYCHIEVIHLGRYGKAKEYHQHYGNK